MPETNPAADDDEPEEALEGDALDLEALKARGDVEGVLVLAKAYRSGTAPGGRDMNRCLEAYRAAAELGNADAEYAVALFCMAGGIVTQDLKEGATRLRAAAEKGSVPAKVYLGNLYELGIHYKADPEKADVWYRNAARGARLEPTAEDYARELAELGCARYVLELVAQGSLDEAEKARLLQRARAHGYGLRLKDDLASERPTFHNALEGAEGTPDLPPALSEKVRRASTPDATTAKGAREAVAAEATSDRKNEAHKNEAHKNEAHKNEAHKNEARKASAKPIGPSRAGIALGAFGYALLFALAGVGAGYAATLGARELVAHGTVLPGLGTRAELVFPIVLGVVGILPTALVYRFGSVLKGLVIGAALGGVGWIAWGTGLAAYHAHRPSQALAFGLAGFLAGLLVLGLLGGTKRQPERAPRRPAR